MRHKSHTKVLCEWQIKKNSQNRVLLRNSKDIMLLLVVCELNANYHKNGKKGNF